MPYRMLKQNFEIGTNFYDTACIERAIIDFSEVAEIFYENGNLTISVDDVGDGEEIFNEFMNHVTALTGEA